MPETQSAQIRYRRASLEDKPGIIILHKSYIAGEDLGKFQDLYLSYYYQELIISNNIVIIAVIENKVIGFCSLVADQRNMVLELMKHRFINLCKIPIKDWFRVISYIYHNIIHEVLGGKWGNSEISQYRSAIELRAVAVDSEYRKSHVGTKLLQTCIEIAQKTNRMPIIAWISESNESSIHLFLRNGFKKAAVRKDKYEDVLLFLLDSDPN